MTDNAYTVSFAPVQLRGAWDVTSLREAVRTSADERADARSYRALREACTRTRKLDQSSPTLVVARDAMERAAAFLYRMTSAPIDTCDPELWLSAADAACAASMLACVPDLDLTGTDPAALAFDVARALDVVLRAADPAMAATAAPPASRRDADARAVPILLCLVSGRAPLVELACRVQAAVACQVKGLSDGATESWRKGHVARLEELVGAGDGQTAHDRLAATLVLLAATADERQRMLWADHPGTEPDLAGCVRDECMALATDSIVGECQRAHVEGPALAGWCAVLGRSPMALVASLPESWERPLTEALATAGAGATA